MNGRKVDVLIEDVFDTDQQTGLRSLARNITVWADDGLKDVIASVDGVQKIYQHFPKEYIVYLDPRYDREFVKQEIEAAILCKEQE